MRRRTMAAAAGLAAILGASAVATGVAVLADPQPQVREQAFTVAVGPEADGKPVALDATLFLPADTRTPAPAVVLAHGFGGSKNDSRSAALELARAGYVALTYTARGFGASGGRISLDAPQYEVRDAQRLIDLLAARREVLSDGPGDPRVGFTGASYGGALSLLVAGYDRRVDAIAPMITWNDLGRSLFPQSAVESGTGPVTTPAGATPIGESGVFKRFWAGTFLGAGGPPTASPPGIPQPGAPQPGQRPEPTTCGRLAPQVCTAYQAAAATGAATPAMLDLMRQSSPASVLERITAPTLLVQGESDSLFPLSEADANARGIAAHGTPVKVVWYGGGHDTGSTEAETARLHGLAIAWFDRYLRRGTPAAGAADTRFEYALAGGRRYADDGARTDAGVLATPGYPGVAGTAPVATTPVALRGAPQTVVAPAGGNPTAVSSLPGLGSVLGQLGALPDTEPTQSAVFESAPLVRPVRLVGAPTVDLQVSGDGVADDATLFVKLYDVGPGTPGEAVLPRSLVAPVRLTGLSSAAGGRTVRVELPAVVHEFAAGHRLRLVVSTTELAYQLPLTARTYRIALAGSHMVSLPQVPGTPVGAGGSGLLPWAAGGLLLTVAGCGGVFLRRVVRERRAGSGIADAAGTPPVPLVISDLGKSYPGGLRAVDDLSFRVERGQVLGLLGPNGAGKTTTLRMLLGLIRPTAGEIRIFGHPVTPGAPVLSRVGAFVEGPGFLPYATGLENLRLYWQATGRPMADARLETALALAGLGDAVHRRVRTYSQGMRQRLAVAQAMLGLPDLLVLDEPTNGLDPPQIREMREALRRYAADGRTVVVSSHLLAEVEQTCTHCVVMHRGRLAAAGPVAELVGAATSVSVGVDDPQRAAQVLAALPGVHGVSPETGGLLVEANGLPRGELVRSLVAAGITVDRVTGGGRRLEDVFLALIGEEQP